MLRIGGQCIWRDTALHPTKTPLVCLPSSSVAQFTHQKVCNVSPLSLNPQIFLHMTVVNLPMYILQVLVGREVSDQHSWTQALARVRGPTQGKFLSVVCTALLHTTTNLSFSLVQSKNMVTLIPEPETQYITNPVVDKATNKCCSHHHQRSLFFALMETTKETQKLVQMARSMKHHGFHELIYLYNATPLFETQGTSQKNM